MPAPRARRTARLEKLGFLGLLLLVACPGADEDPLVRRGRGVYLANCSACHAANPSQAGGVGPAVADASRELLHSRLVLGVYPPGYEPKRSTGVMPRFPHLEPELDALYAFLSAGRVRSASGDEPGS